MTVLVFGTGLIGTSVALALRASGEKVLLADADEATAKLAADLGGGTVVPDLRDAKGVADVAVLAMPPAAVAAALAFGQEHGVADVYTDVASVKELPVRQARELGCDLSSYVPGHPLAGRERHGPAAARADLFLGRTWALCPLPETSPAAVEAVTALVRACGGDPVTTDPATHDRWVALISHAPHVVAAAMAARLAPSSVPGDALKLAGQGLRDVTRVAAGDTALWTEILLANPGPVAEVLAAVADDLAGAARSLGVSAETPAGDVTGLLERGRAGVARIPGKHGGQPRHFTVVQVVIADKPGELARLFDAAGAAGVNIEDVRIEHSPGLPVGVAELSVRPDQSAVLLDAMEAGGWPVRRQPVITNRPGYAKLDLMSDSAKPAAPKAKADQAVPEADVKQGEPEPVTEPAEAAGADPAQPDMDEVKRKFREALDRKRQAHADGQGNGAQDQGKIHGSHGPAASRRNFRRKSG